MSTTSDLRKRDGALVENWYIACLSRELGKKPLRCVIYDVPYVLYRDENGRAVCLPDRCLHRHAQLSEGVVIDGKIACPYHGWMYDSSGQVVAIPSQGSEPDCARPSRELCLKPMPSAEQDGCVWIWRGIGEPRTTTPPFRFPHQDDPDFARYFMITDFDNEVTHLAENFMDVPHTVFVHAGWFRSRKARKVPISVETASGSVLVTYRQPDDSIGFTDRILNPRNEPMTHTDRFLLPNLTRVDYGFGARNTFVIISQITPESTLKCRVYTAIIYRVGPRWVTRALKGFMRFYTRRVIEQDVKIMAIQGANFRHDMTTDFRATDADVVHTAIEKLRAWGAEGDPRAVTHVESVERNIWI